MRKKYFTFQEVQAAPPQGEVLLGRSNGLKRRAEGEMIFLAQNK